MQLERDFKNLTLSNSNTFVTYINYSFQDIDNMLVITTYHIDINQITQMYIGIVRENSVYQNTRKEYKISS